MNETYETLIAKLKLLMNKEVSEEEKQQMFDEIDNFLKFILKN